jgi:hypothetical protein
LGDGYRVDMKAKKIKPPEGGFYVQLTVLGGKGRIRTDGTPKGTLDFELNLYDHNSLPPFNLTVVRE